MVPGLVICGAGAGLVTPDRTTSLGQIPSPLLARPFIRGQQVSHTFTLGALFAAPVTVVFVVMGWRLTLHPPTATVPTLKPS